MSREAVRKLEIPSAIEFDLKAKKQKLAFLNKEGNALIDEDHNIKVAVQNDISLDYEQGYFVDESQGIEAVRDKAGTTHIFHLDTAGNLLCYVPEEDAALPWASRNLTVDISTSFNGNASSLAVKSFYVASEETGDMSLVAVTESRAADDGMASVFLIDGFDLARGDQAWQKFGPSQPVDVSYVKSVRTPLAKGQVDAGDEELLFIAGQSTDMAKTPEDRSLLRGYVLKVDEETAGLNFWPEVVLVDDTEKLVHSEFGYQTGPGEGLYILGESDAGSVLGFYSVEDWEKYPHGAMPAFFLPHHKKPGAFASLLGDERDEFGERLSWLFYTAPDPETGVNTLYSMSPKDQTHGSGIHSEKIHDFNLGAGVSKISAVEGEDGRWDIYTHSNDGMIVKVSKETGKPWMEPTLLMDKVKSMAPVGEGGSLTNEIVTFSDQHGPSALFSGNRKSGSFSHYMQAENNLWKWNQVKVPEEINPNNNKIWMNSLYLTFRNDDGSQIVSADGISPLKVRLRSSETIELKANGDYYVLTKDNEVEVDLQSDTSLSLQVEANGIGQPLVTVDADFLENAITINPMFNAHSRFASISTGDLRTPKDRYGEAQKLVPESVSEHNLQQGQMALEKCSGLLLKKGGLEGLHAPDTMDLPAGTASAFEGLKGSGIYLTPSGERQSNVLNMTAFTDDECRFALTGNKGKLTFHDSAATATTILPVINDNFALQYKGKGDANDFWSWVGDIFMHVVNGIRYGNWDDFTIAFEKFVDGTKEGIRMVVEVAGRAWHCLLEKMEHIGEAVATVIESVLEAMEEVLVSLLGFILPWDQIRPIHTTLERCAEYGRNQLESSVEKLQSMVLGSLDDLESKLRKLREDIAPVEKYSASDEQKEMNKWVDDRGQGDDFAHAMDLLINNPVAKWGQEQLQRILRAGLGDLAAPPDIGAAAESHFKAFMKDDVQPVIKSQLEHIRQVAKNLWDSLSKGDVTTKSIEQFFSTLALDLIALGVGTLSKVTRLVFGLFKVVFATVADLLMKKSMRIPFITVVYKSDFCLGSKKTPTLLSQLIMAISIPAGLVVSMFGGVNPFNDFKPETLDDKNADPAQNAAWQKGYGVWGAGLSGFIVNSLRTLLSGISFGMKCLEAKHPKVSFAIGLFNMGLRLLFLALVCPALTLAPDTPTGVVVTTWVFYGIVLVDFVMSGLIFSVRHADKMLDWIKSTFNRETMNNTLNAMKSIIVLPHAGQKAEGSVDADASETFGIVLDVIDLVVAVLMGVLAILARIGDLVVKAIGGKGIPIASSALFLIQICTANATRWTRIVVPYITSPDYKAIGAAVVYTGMGITWGLHLSRTLVGIMAYYLPSDDTGDDYTHQSC